MNKYIQIIRKTLSLLIIFLLTSIIGCTEEGAITSYKESTTPSDNPAYKRDHYFLSTTLVSLDENADSSSSYFQSASCNVRFFKNYNQYRGSSCQIPNGSFFELNHGALTPPDYIPWGEEVTITMSCDKDPLSGELIFTFGPSGCQFDPPARLWLDWTDLGSDTAKLFLLNKDGSREEQTPDQIDVFNKHMLIQINHFSRYALAYSN